MLAAQIQTLAPQLLGLVPSSKSRTEWRFRTRGSMAVAIAGQDRGLWHDHEAGIGGDALDLVAYTRNCDRKEAWRWSMDWLGQSPTAALPAFTPVPETRRAAREPQEQRSVDLARTIWAAAIPPSGTVIETYLRSRGLQLQPGAPIRFHPLCPRGMDHLPAMVALMTDPATNAPIGIHRTFLQPDGSGKADVKPTKMMLGTAGIIRLSRDEDSTMGLGICEGIETGLAILQLIQWGPIWACGSAGGIARFPVLPGIEALTIFADADDQGAGLLAAQSCAEHWTAAGREVTIQTPPAGTDWLDALRGGRDA